MQEKGRSRPHRILCVVTGCGGGDWPPLLAVAEGLHRCGHDLVVVCDSDTVKCVQDSGLAAFCLPADLDLKNVFEPALSRLLAGKEKLHPGCESPFKAWGRSSAECIRNYLDHWRPSLVITSLLGVGLGETLAKSFSTPWCFLNPSFYFGENCAARWQTDFSEMGAQMYRHWLLPIVQTADLVLHATDEAFDICPGELPPRHAYVGPVFWELAGSEEMLLKKSDRPLALISVSTSPQSGELAIVRTALAALETMGFQALVTLAAGHNRNDLGRIPANAHVKGYTPHSKVLPHCRLVISHAGHGIVMKSMSYGVPMVLIPWGRDQPGVADRAKRLGLAVVIPRAECSVSAVAAAVGDVLKEPKYVQKALAVSRRLGKMDGVASAVDHIESFLMQ